MSCPVDEFDHLQVKKLLSHGKQTEKMWLHRISRNDINIKYLLCVFSCCIITIITLSFKLINKETFLASPNPEIPNLVTSKPQNKDLVMEICEANKDAVIGQEKLFSVNRYLIDTKDKYTACITPKVASSTWMEYFRRLAQNEKVNKGFSPASAWVVINSYFSYKGRDRQGSWVCVGGGALP